MRIIILLCRIVAGALFIFSGTVKAIDPLGSVYKFHDYFQAFGLEILQPLSLPLAIILFTTEFITGFSVLFAIRVREGNRDVNTDPFLHPPNFYPRPY
jgi:uncharacterized membrane protein YphA (DoxX/SURF4 family)